MLCLFQVYSKVNQLYIYMYLLFIYLKKIFDHTVRHGGSLVPRPGLKPVPTAVEAHSLNRWTAREVPIFFRFFSHIGHYRVLSRVPCAIQ